MQAPNSVQYLNKGYKSYHMIYFQKQKPLLDWNSYHKNISHVVENIEIRVGWLDSGRNTSGRIIVHCVVFSFL